MENKTHTPALEKVRQMLRMTYFVVPVVAGADKFINFLTDWPQYLAPYTTDLLPFSGQTFMMIVGAIEITAGFLVLFRTRLGSGIVAAWLVLISLSLLLGGHYFDVAVRDLVMAIGAWALFALSQADTGAANKLSPKRI